jgi:hypothetical protein
MGNRLVKRHDRKVKFVITDASTTMPSLRRARDRSQEPNNDPASTQLAPESDQLAFNADEPSATTRMVAGEPMTDSGNVDAGVLGREYSEDRFAMSHNDAILKAYTVFGASPDLIKENPETFVKKNVPTNAWLPSDATTNCCRPQDDKFAFASAHETGPGRHRRTRLEEVEFSAITSEGGDENNALLLITGADTTKSELAKELAQINRWRKTKALRYEGSEMTDRVALAVVISIEGLQLNGSSSGAYEIECAENEDPVNRHSSGDGNIQDTT